MDCTTKTKYTDYSIPLVLFERYFIIESGRPAQITVIMGKQDRPVIEIRKNKPTNNNKSVISRAQSGLINVSDKYTDKLIYTLKPGVHPKISFTTANGKTLNLLVMQHGIKLDGFTMPNSRFNGLKIGLVVDGSDELKMKCPVPSEILRQIF